MKLTKEQSECLTTIADFPLGVEPKDADTKRICKELVGMKLLRPQPMMDGNMRMFVTYSATAKGRDAAPKGGKAKV